jgi:hypothetical protein
MSEIGELAVAGREDLPGLKVEMEHHFYSTV